jgi:hypothetical protein
MRTYSGQRVTLGPNEAARVDVDLVDRGGSE